MTDIFKEMVEAFLPQQRAYGNEVVVIYRHEADPDIRFAVAYKSEYESLGARKMWQKQRYALNHVYDLERLDGLTDRERNRQRVKNRSSIGE